ncbi:MAG TPA: hypothetical protein VLZ31_08485 [Microbacteriaceae bacterium]|nr:hypothetical protein [Microbacteriaceae bacterium]
MIFIFSEGEESEWVLKEGTGTLAKIPQCTDHRTAQLAATLATRPIDPALVGEAQEKTSSNNQI